MRGRTYLFLGVMFGPLVFSLAYRIAHPYGRYQLAGAGGDMRLDTQTGEVRVCFTDTALFPLVSCTLSYEQVKVAARLVGNGRTPAAAIKQVEASVGADTSPR